MIKFNPLIVPHTSKNKDIFFLTLNTIITPDKISSNWLMLSNIQSIVKSSQVSLIIF